MLNEKFENYLGTAADPQPIARDAAPDGNAWPKDAVFAVIFERVRFPRFPWDAHFGRATSFTEFFGPDGWPVCMPDHEKAGMSDVMKRELQVCPHHCSTWDEESWADARNNAELFARSRAQAEFAFAIAEMVAPLADDLED